MKRPPLLHPWLFALFPAVFLYQVNPAIFAPGVLLVPLTASLALAAIAWFPLRAWIGHRNKAALALSFAILASFSFGVLRASLVERTLRLGQLRVGAEGVALLCGAAVFALGLCLLLRARRELNYLTAIANVTALVLLLLSVGAIVTYKMRQRTAFQKRPPRQTLEILCGTPAAITEKPSVYFLILDAYGRSDVLRDVYQFDNHELTGFLRDRGFYVASASYAGYMQTIFSLASSLNLDYVQNFAGEHAGRVDDRAPLLDAIRSSRLAALLGKQGYRTVAFSTGLSATEVSGADRYLSRPWFLNDFEDALLVMTPLPAALAQVGISQYDLHRRRILYNLDRLPELARRPEPQFVFAHLLVPHPPFVFGENGEPVDPQRPFSLADADFLDRGGNRRIEYLREYRRQAVFITHRIRQAIEEILANSVTPPIIVLQSDHGPGSLVQIRGSLQENPCLQERFGILNACLLPKRDYAGFYEAISPVNTWRLVVNKYFGTNCGRAPDASYFSNWDQPYQFVDVTGKMGCAMEKLDDAPPTTRAAAP